MRAFKEVDAISGEGAAYRPILRKRKQHILSVVLMFVLSFSCMGLSLSSLAISKEVRNITSYWAPNISGLGKIKFVSKDEEKDAAALIEDFSMPFENSFATEIATGVFQFDGLGALLVRACMEGRVEKIEQDGDLKTIRLAHGNNLKTEYSLIDTLGVKEGDGVEKNTALGISHSSKVVFKVLYKNKLLTGLRIVDGELSFL